MPECADQQSEQGEMTGVATEEQMQRFQRR